MSVKVILNIGQKQQRLQLHRLLFPAKKSFINTSSIYCRENKSDCLFFTCFLHIFAFFVRMLATVRLECSSSNRRCNLAYIYFGHRIGKGKAWVI